VAASTGSSARPVDPCWESQPRPPVGPPVGHSATLWETADRAKSSPSAAQCDRPVITLPSRLRGTADSRVGPAAGSQPNLTSRARIPAGLRPIAAASSVMAFGPRHRRYEPGVPQPDIQSCRPRLEAVDRRPTHTATAVACHGPGVFVVPPREQCQQHRTGRHSGRVPRRLQADGLLVGVAVAFHNWCWRRASRPGGGQLRSLASVTATHSLPSSTAAWCPRWSVT